MDMALPSFSIWIVGLLLGSTATIVSGIAVAGLGLGMLTGRIDLRRGAFVVIGCFILFSSRTIADALIASTQDTQSFNDTLPVSAKPAYVPLIPPSVAYDPYAGASVPVRAPDSASSLLPK